VRRPRGLRVTVADAWRGQRCSDGPSAEYRIGAAVAVEGRCTPKIGGRRERESPSHDDEASMGAFVSEGRRGQSPHAIIHAERAARVNPPTTSQSETSASASENSNRARGLWPASLPRYSGRAVPSRSLVMAPTTNNKIRSRSRAAKIGCQRCVRRLIALHSLSLPKADR
jgi:hypothetical protein